MYPVTEINTFLSLKSPDGRVLNSFILITAKSGFGKSLTSEAIAEKYHKAGYCVIFLSDVKDAFENGFAMFKPEERYHLEQLRVQGTMPSSKKVKIYHPFCFGIPSGFLPDINFYTFSIKDLTRREINFLTESFYDSDVTKLMLSAIQNISKEDGIFGMLHHLQEQIKGKKKGRQFIPDPKNFYLSATIGTLKSLQGISNNFQLFKQDYFIAKDNCSINLDIRKVLQDRESFHVFSTKWVKDEKLKSFCILALLNQIIKNSDYAKYPVVIVIPEIRKLTPMKPEGFKIFLADLIKESLSTMRSMGKGMSAILDSQVFEDIDEDVVDSCTNMLIGELGGARDVERICKALGYGKDIRNQLKRMEERNSYFLMGQEDMGAFKMFVPSFMHKEENYSFIEMYKKYFGDKMKRYDDLTNMMQKIYKEEEEKVRQKARRMQEEELAEMDKKIKEKQVNKREDSEELEQEVKVLKSEKNKIRDDAIVKIYLDSPELSLREIAEKVSGIVGKVSYGTVKVVLEKYKKNLESVSVENETLEEGS